MTGSPNNLSWECYRLVGVAGANHWRELIESRLKNGPFAYDNAGNAIRVWKKEAPAIPVPGSPLTCRNAIRINKVNFGGNRQDSLIGISIARLIFEPGSSQPSKDSHHDVFATGKYPDVLRHQYVINDISPLISWLTEAIKPHALEKHQDFSVHETIDEVHYRLGKNSAISLREMHEGNGLSKNLLHMVRNQSAGHPVRIRLGILNLLDQSRAAKISRLATEIEQVLRAWGCRVACFTITPDDRLEALQQKANGTRPVVLIPLEGTKGERPPDTALQKLRELDAHGIAFQLCTVHQNPLYSRHGIALRILGMAGGLFYRSEPTENEFFHQSVFVGLDIGFGGQGQAQHKRIAAITLTSNAGQLLGYWRFSRGSSETFSAQSLQLGLRWIRELAMTRAPDKHLFVIRDGRLPADEKLEDYQTAFEGNNFTLIEYAKRGSPLMHINAQQPTPGTIISPHNSDFHALYPCTSPQHGVLSNPTKFKMTANPNKLTAVDVGRFLTALCHSATLSWQPSRLPAPIQWANGLAARSESNLQFAGWSHVANAMVVANSPETPTS